MNFHGPTIKQVGGIQLGFVVIVVSIKLEESLSSYVCNKVNCFFSLAGVSFKIRHSPFLFYRGFPNFMSTPYHPCKFYMPIMVVNFD